MRNIYDGKKEKDGKEIEPQLPYEKKQLSIQETNDKQAYVLISTSVTEEVSIYIHFSNTTPGGLNKLKEIYDSHSKLEIIQLILKLFNLKMKDNDHMKLVQLFFMILNPLVYNQIYNLLL